MNKKTFQDVINAKKNENWSKPLGFATKSVILVGIKEYIPKIKEIAANCNTPFEIVKAINKHGQQLSIPRDSGKIEKFSKAIDRINSLIR